MRTLFLLFTFSILFSMNIYPQKNLGEASLLFLDYKLLDTSNVYGGFYNIGLTDYPHYINWRLIDPSIITFGYGLHVIGKINDYPHLAIAQWSSAYSPGPIINGQAAMLIHPEDSLRYRIYKISKGDNVSNPDYAEWPSDFGAPVNSLGEPQVYGDQTLWTVYNSMDSTVEYRINWNNYRDSLPVMPLEVQQLIYSRSGYQTDYEDLFSNTMFFEFKILNKGSEQIDSAFIGFWTDIDFCFAGSNPPAVDTSIQSGFCWTTNLSTCSIPPAIGYAMLYGPIIESQGDTAQFGQTRIPDFKNSSLSSFYPVAQDQHPYFDAYYTLEGAWNIARGFYENGETIVNPITNQPTKFPLDGDPVTNQGWIWQQTQTNGEAGFYLFTGPYTLAPGDSQWIMLALAPALGRNNLESISLMRKKILTLRNQPYDSLAFGTASLFITSVEETPVDKPNDYLLYQNYPNPFNPITKISWQSPIGTWQTLIVYDVLGNEVSTLVNEYRDAGSYDVEFDGGGLASGVYYYQLKAGDLIQTKKMILLK
ncbi:MAG: T9SS type A sorting domain-containing protein [Ignavibacteriales bacterium]|nr:MAG: T9SS type A sorting domain-containing protein [Ignavibacteriales bacterium]